MLETGLAWLETQRKASLATAVAYNDGTNPEATGLAATPGETDYQWTQEDGTVANVQGHDFLIAAADLAAALPGWTKPARGHKITYNGQEYEVNAPEAEPVWQWHNKPQQVYRIHTQHIGAAT